MYLLTGHVITFFLILIFILPHLFESALLEHFERSIVTPHGDHVQSGAKKCKKVLFPEIKFQTRNLLKCGLVLTEKLENSGLFRGEGVSGFADEVIL